jgi:hypothetical protein
MFDSSVEWANESYQLVTSPTTGYCVQKQGACWYSVNNMILNRGESKKVVDISGSYVEDHTEIVEQRIKQAGVRLGALLNAVMQ